MAIKKLYEILRKPFKHGWNLLLMLTYISLSSILLLITFSGFIDIAKTFEETQTGMNTFISFIVLSLTLAILAYTAAQKEKINELYLRVGRNFSISTILFFIGFIAYRGLNSELIQQIPEWLKTLTVLIVAFALFYSIISFVAGLFMLLTIQTGLWEKFEKDMKEAKEWLDNSKYKKWILSIVIILYIILIFILKYRSG